MLEPGFAGKEGADVPGKNCGPEPWVRREALEVMCLRNQSFQGESSLYSNSLEPLASWITAGFCPPSHSQSL